jgi:hypothetical protein
MLWSYGISVIVGSYSWFIKENFKKASTTIIIQTNLKYDDVEKSLLLVIVVDNDGKVLNIFTLVSKPLGKVFFTLTNTLNLYVALVVL